MSLQLACAQSGQLRSFVNAAGPLLDSPSPDDKKMARSFLDPFGYRIRETLLRGKYYTRRS